MRIVRLTENDLTRIVRRVIMEEFPGEDTNLNIIDRIINGSGQSSVQVKSFCDYCKRKSDVEVGQIDNTRADKIRDAIQGWGTSEKIIFEVFNQLQQLEDFCQLWWAYYQTYNIDLFEDLDDDIDSESEWVQILRPLRNAALNTRKRLDLMKKMEDHYQKYPIQNKKTQTPNVNKKPTTTNQPKKLPPIRVGDKPYNF